MANPTPTPEDLALVEGGNFDVDEALDESGLGRSTFFELMRDGSIPSIKIGRRRFIPKRGLWRYLAEHLVTDTTTR